MREVEHLANLRQDEVRCVHEAIAGHGARLLEIGAGTGHQAAQLQALGWVVEAVDLEGRYLEEVKAFPVRNYDGRHLPYPDSSFDVVFSSNVLEHVPDLPAMHAEIKRVLRPGGIVVHVLPTHTWRIWQTLLSWPQAAKMMIQGMPLRRWVARCFPRRHGERGNVLTEAWYFRPEWWRRHFRGAGYALLADRPTGLLYTGHMLFGPSLPMWRRRRLARRMGSSCHLFVMRVSEEREDAQVLADRLNGPLAN